MDRSKLPFRPCAGVMLLNRDGLAFVQKPFKGRHLLASVRDVLRQPVLRP